MKGGRWQVAGARGRGTWQGHVAGGTWQVKYLSCTRCLKVLPRGVHAIPGPFLGPDAWAAEEWGYRVQLMGLCLSTAFCLFSCRKSPVFDQRGCEITCFCVRNFPKKGCTMFEKLP